MTITEYYTELVNTSIVGINSLTSIPQQVSTAILPCKFVRFNTANVAVLTLSQTNGLPTYTFDVVFILEPVGQNTNIANQTLVMSVSEKILDYVESINDILSCTLSFEVNLFSNTPYWGLIATIEILGG
jgi:hypothetical protein